MQHWLFKSEPHKFSWDDLTSSPLSTAPWDGKSLQSCSLMSALLPLLWRCELQEGQLKRGKKHAGVRNYVARNHMLEMKVGDQGFFYHSSCKVVRCALSSCSSDRVLPFISSRRCLNCTASPTLNPQSKPQEAIVWGSEEETMMMKLKLG